MTTSSSQIQGLASGFDTASIIEELMKIEKMPYDKLDVQKKTAEIKRQAYQAVNSMLLKFRTSVSSLASQSLWKSKTASSTNENSLTATAGTIAANGTYSLRVAQLAASAQFMSKGFANSKTALVKQPEGATPEKLGTITLNNAKSRVDNSVKLEELNGGRGVYRGSIRVTDSANNNAVIDLAACSTMNDVVTAINNSSGARIKASIVDGKLVIDDEAGGSNVLKITNHGTGSTATNLGIATSADTPGGSITSKNLYYIANDSSTSILNDGMGMEEGTMSLVIGSGAESVSVNVDLTEVGSIGDVIKRVNDEISAYTNIYRDAGNDEYADMIDGLKFGINADGTGFSLTGTKAGHTYTFSDNLRSGMISQTQCATQLGLTGKSHIVTANGEEVKFDRVIGTVDSPLLRNLGGANSTGIGNYTSYAPILDPAGLTGSTKLKQLNLGTGIDISTSLQIRLFEGGKGITENDSQAKVFTDILDPVRLNELATSDTATVDDLVSFINTSLTNYAADPDNNAGALAGLQIGLLTPGSGDNWPAQLVLTGSSAAHTIEVGGSLSGSLLLTRAGNNALQNPNSTQDQQDYKAAVEDFYTPANKLVGDNQEIRFTEVKDEDGNVTQGKTKLSDLVGYDDTDPDAFLDTLKQSMNLTVGSKTFTVDYADLGITIDGDTTVEDYMNAVNTALKTKAESEGVQAPQLTVDRLGTGLRWSNINTSEGFSASGGLAAALSVDKTWDPTAHAFDGKVPFQPYLTSDLRPADKGYYKPEAVTENTKLGFLNGGKGLTLSPTDGTINIKLDGNRSLTLTMQDIRDAIGNSLEHTVSEYADILTTLVNQKLQDEGYTDVSMKFGYEDGQINITEVKGTTSLTINGDGVTTGNVGFGWVEVEKLDASTVIKGGKLTAGSLQPFTASGLGDLVVEKEDGSKIRLTTDGLDQNSTLGELIKKLNEQAQAKGLDAEFAVNNAGTGLTVLNTGNESFKFIHDDTGGTLGSDLGLFNANNEGYEVDVNTSRDGGSLGRKYVGRSTKLDTLATAGDKLVLGSLNITDATGKSVNVDVTECKTVGDIIDSINMFPDLGVKAILNERGDGITLIEAYSVGYEPTFTPTGNISMADGDGGNVAKILGITGTGKMSDELGVHVLEGSQRTEIEVMTTDSLESLMYRISEAGYKTAIVNDGSGSNQYRLSISSSSTGAASDFVIESDLDMFGFSQTSRGKDSKVLYGDPNTGSSPVLLSSSSNTNNTAIPGLTLNLKEASESFTTITVETDKEKVVEEIKNLVQTYNDLNDLISYLDAPDEETGDPGILSGDTSVRSLMEEITDMFYQVFNPDSLSYSESQTRSNNTGEQQTYTWMDIGLSLTAKNTNPSDTASGTWYSTMELDLDALTEFVDSKWDTLEQMLAGQRNASNSTLKDTVKATASFNGTAATGFKADNAINGDANTASWGANNGFMADGTIEDGQNQYTIFFQKPTTITRMSIYHFDSDTSLSDFTVEYMDQNGNWQTEREIKDNSSNANHLGLAMPTTVSAVRITAKDTNASDGKFRLLDVQIFEDIGLAGQLNQLTTRLGDTLEGWFATQNTNLDDEVRDIDEQMERLAERLESKEASLWRQFTAMETALGQLQNQGNYLTSMMDSMKSSK